MSDAITIMIPAVDEASIAMLETERPLVAATEETLLAALRTRYAPLARHNGFVRVAWYSKQTSNYSTEREEFYCDGAGRKVKAFLVVDQFDREHDDQNRGSLTGARLYLTAGGEWLAVERMGHWSQWQGEAQYWSAGVSIDNSGSTEREWDEYGPIGSTQTMTDAEVAHRFPLTEVVGGLSKALGGLNERIPERLAKMRQRAALAAKLLEALT